MVHALERVRFDFDGSLQLARKLWQLAVDIDTEARNRANQIADAQHSWRGPLRREFDQSATAEATNFQSVAAYLKQEAEGWASSWQQAMNEQNRRNRARRERDISSSRSNMEKLYDAIVGYDDSGDQLGPVPYATKPVPPQFLPTQHEVFR